MAELAASLAKEHWMWIVVILFGIMMICVYVAMSVTHRMERRQMEQFDREFTGRFQAVSLEEER
ncbi:hypothetical protein CLV97_12131 [Planifilum fimeticola]|uniref:Uncharacterized protein n=1 Tax=Planifilum fimeticola TaxID=201975 RepID=A0A2T0LCM8_9BACL|nr:hypothetical protein [Planifilum fimeticola]PRX39704.1 hypothetical protein CLV97_12131 [Planifilum fimeticola]